MSIKVKAGARRRVLSWPLFGLTLGTLMVGAPGARAAGPVLPTGGRVAAGQAVIGAPTAGALTISQSSSKAIIDWSGFSIGAGGKVSFQNGAGATLNRVTGTGVSALDGLLTGAGSVYVLNPNGVIIGRSGVVRVGGAFVASTLDVSDAGFLASGPLSFTGPSTAEVVNLGKVGALGGDVALVGARVFNAGTLSAPQGSAALAAGRQVIMLRDAALDGGAFSVLLGGADTTATNAGLIEGADAELRAEGGNVYALAGDTAGVIRATGVTGGGGHVWLTAEGGTLDVAGAVTARGAGGTGGAIETSGGKVTIGSARIDAHGGTWLVDPYDLTIDATAATSIDNALNAGTSVTEQTTATGSSGAGVANASGSGEITVAAPISWSTAAGLTLSAYRDVAVNAPITSTGGGAVTLYADNTGTGTGSVSFGAGATVSTSGAVNLFYNPAGNDPTTVNTTSYTTPTNYGAYVVGSGTLTGYMLVNTVYDLQNVQNDLAGTYALGRDIDASSTAGWSGGTGFSPIGKDTLPYSTAPQTTGSFSGLLNGQGHVINNLYINLPGAAGAGLFGGVSGSIGNIILNSVSITGNSDVGGLAGNMSGSAHDVQVRGTVSGNSNDVGGIFGILSGSLMNVAFSGTVNNSRTLTGGIVGWNTGSIMDATSSGILNGGGDAGGIFGWNEVDYTPNVSSSNLISSMIVNSFQYSGGIVGENSANISNAYFTGVVGGNGAMIVGGIAGVNSTSTITSSYSSGRVIGSGGALIGSGAIQNSYWDEGTSGQSQPVGQLSSALKNVVGIGGNSGLSPYAQSTYSNFDFSASGPWVIFNGSTRPILKSEYSTTITNAHQLQLIALNPAATYTLASNIDASGTTNPSDVWNTATGFVPVGNGASPFSGTFNGAGHVISGLTVNQPSAYEVGLFGVTAPGSLIENVAMSGGGVTGNTYVGDLVGLNQGTLIGVSEIANVTATNAYVGGLVGYNTGAITTGVANGPVNGSYFVGGLVGWDATGGAVSGGYASGAVSGNSYTGGLVGYNAGTISGAGAINAVSANGAYTGGSVGYNSGTLVNLGAYGGVIGGYGAGGLAGGNSGTIYNGYASGPIIGFQDVGGAAGLNSGAIVGAVSSSSVSASNANAGGLAGDNAGSVSYALAAGPVNTGYNSGGLIGYNEKGATIAASSADGAVSGSSNVGGLVGSNAGSVSQSFATGGVSGTNAYAGGLVGDNLGSLGDAYSTGAVRGNYFVASLTGRNDGQIARAYATGAVSGTAYVAGAIGFNTGSAASVYWDVGATGSSTGVAYEQNASGDLITGIGGSTGRSSYVASSYAGFDFTNVWTINPGASRPYLLADPQSPPPT